MPLPTHQHYTSLTITIYLTDYLPGDKKELCVDDFSLQREQVDRARQEVIPGINIELNIKDQIKVGCQNVVFVLDKSTYRHVACFSFNLCHILSLR